LERSSSEKDRFVIPFDYVKVAINQSASLQ